MKKLTDMERIDIARGIDLTTELHEMLKHLNDIKELSETYKKEPNAETLQMLFMAINSIKLNKIKELITTPIELANYLLINEDD